MCPAVSSQQFTDAVDGMFSDERHGAATAERRIKAVGRADQSVGRNGALFAMFKIGIESKSGNGLKVSINCPSCNYGVEFHDHYPQVGPRPAILGIPVRDC